MQSALPSRSYVRLLSGISFFLFFFTAPATTEIYTLSLHDALPISRTTPARPRRGKGTPRPERIVSRVQRSEEHTSELQSPDHLVCRLLLEKKKQTNHTTETISSNTISLIMIHHPSTLRGPPSPSSC